jgi:tetratricopeptide (TPR) repeat protein
MNGQIRASLTPVPAVDAQPGDRPLRGWKQIADFLGRDERTVRRWHRERGLPVHRAPGIRRSAVHAFREELETWLRTGAQTPSPSRPTLWPWTWRGRGRANRIILIAASVVLMALVGLAIWQPAFLTGNGAQHEAAAAAREHYLRGTYLWEKRTRTDLEEALREFRQAVAIDPDYAAAHVGIADTYNLLRQYGLMPAPQAYAAAAEAGRRAVELEPANARSQAALGFTELYGLRMLDTGIWRLELARRLDGHSATIRHWLANAYLHVGRFREALDEINEAQRLDPTSRSVLSSKGLALFHNGEIAAATELLTGLTRREPDFLAPHVYLSYIHLAQANYPAFLESLRNTGRLRGDASRIAVADAGERGLREGGFRGMLAAMIEQEQAEVEAGASLHYNLARLHALSGDIAAVQRHLAAAIVAREDPLMGVSIDPAFRTMTSRREVRTMLAGAGLPVL